MKGTVPNHDQPVAMTNNIDVQNATAETKQQVVFSGSYKVRTSAAFLGLAIASGILIPKGNDRVAAVEVSNPEPNPAMQASSPVAANSQAVENSALDGVPSSSDWQPSLLRTLNGSNQEENEANSPAHADLELAKPDKSSAEALKQPEPQAPVAASESFPQSATFPSSSSDPNSESNLAETEIAPASEQSKTVLEPYGVPSNSFSPIQPSSETSPLNSANSLSRESSGAFVIAPETAETEGSVVYQVGSGDTLDKIAHLHNVSVEAIIQANRITDPNWLSVNQSLKIPKQLASSLTGDLSTPVTVQGQGFSTDLEASRSLNSVSSPTEFSVLGSRLPQAVVPVVIPSDVNAQAQEITDLSAVPTSSTLEKLSLKQLASIQDVKAVESPLPVDPASVPIPDGSNRLSGSEKVAAEDVFEQKSESVSRLYTNRLRAEVERLREDYRAQSDYQVMNVAMEDSQKPEVQALTSAVTSPLHRLQRINPEFNPDGYSRQKATQTEGSLSAQQLAQMPTSAQNQASQLQPQSKQSVVATAPIGTNAYDPLNNPALGRMVSPQLPPLLGPDAYLPSGSLRFTGYIWPAEGILTSGYGWRWGRMHRGIDIAGPVGTPIFAAAPGVVTYAGWNDGGYGNLVEIEHPDGSLTVYAHNSRVLVNEGQQVAQGDQISEMGSTGRSTGPHLHFEIHPNGQGAINPMALLPKENSQVSQDY